MLLEPITDAWELEDATKRHRHAPDLYQIPVLAALFRMHVGDRVELRFSFRGCDRHGPFLQSERHWLVVSELTGDKGVAVLCTEPTCFPLLHAGDRIPFEHRHIASIQRGPHWKTGNCGH